MCSRGFSWEETFLRNPQQTSSYFSLVICTFLNQSLSSMSYWILNKSRDVESPLLTKTGREENGCEGNSLNAHRVLFFLVRTPSFHLWCPYDRISLIQHSFLHVLSLIQGLHEEEVAIKLGFSLLSKPTTIFWPFPTSHSFCVSSVGFSAPK